MIPMDWAMGLFFYEAKIIAREISLMLDKK